MGIFVFINDNARYEICDLNHHGAHKTRYEHSVKASKVDEIDQETYGQHNVWTFQVWVYDKRCHCMQKHLVVEEGSTDILELEWSY